LPQAKVTTALQVPFIANCYCLCTQLMHDTIDRMLTSKMRAPGLSNVGRTCWPQDITPWLLSFWQRIKFGLQYSFHMRRNSSLRSF